MPSPFPGMDPYVEAAAAWPTFHHHLIAAVYQLLLPGLVDRYRARVAVRQYVSETPLFTSVLREQHAEEYIEVRSRADARLVTLVDVVSPANKTSPAGRTAYLATRSQAVAARAGVVEIDLVTQGRPTLDFDRTGLPAYDYAITVTRGGTPDRYEVYTSPVQERLKKFKLPLATDDRDTVLDLQVCVARAYDQGNVGQLVSYSGPLPTDVRLSDEARAWVVACLEKQNLR